METMETKKVETRVELKPPTKIVIHNIIPTNLESIIKMATGPMGTAPLFWANGVAFLLNALPLQSKALDLYIDGELHIADVIFTEMEEYNVFVEINRMIANVIDMSKSPIHSAISTILKTWLNANATNTNNR